MAKSKATPMDNDADDYQGQSDAECLAKAAEIQADPDRHARAKGHLDKKSGAMQDASAQAEEVSAKHATDGEDADTQKSTAKAPGRKGLKDKVKIGLAKAFPRD